jgi:2,3-bisphosphoglycerate-independent phosphoglycerate mutase
VEGAARILDVSPVNVERRERGSLPGNLILTRDAGDHRPRLQPIRDRFGWGWGCFVEMPVERGISLALGMDAVDAPRLDAAGFGSAAEEAYAVWAGLAAEALDAYQALYVHIKGPDVPAHDGRADDKRKVIEAIDGAFFGEVLPRLRPERTVVGVLADHATSCARKAHTADPVPLILAGGPFTSDGTTSYGERSCAEGSLGELRGVDVLRTVRSSLT